MKTKMLLCILIGLGILGLTDVSAINEVISEYGHISLGDKTTTILHPDKTQEMATINLPIAPGDKVVTGPDGRCEIEFDNGSIVRLDNNTTLTITTLHAPTITTNQRVTTLSLTRGHIYAMIQSYDKEICQIITPHAAIHFKQGTAAFIRLTDSRDTYIQMDKGKCHVLYGEAIHSLKTTIITQGKDYLVSPIQGLMMVEEKKDVEFSRWNDDVNHHVQNLHQGINKIPKEIYRYNKGLVNWAEKWSNLYGEWLFDDLFGYVWKPADEIFSFSKRPFFHAGIVQLRGELFLVPQQSWGWVPAHMGTWVWMKWGWTWIPGDVFFSGVSRLAPFLQINTLDYWITLLYGNYNLYYNYRSEGKKSWRHYYQVTLQKEAQKPTLKNLPNAIRTIIKDINKVPITTLQSKLGSNRPTPAIDKEKLTPYLERVLFPEARNSCVTYSQTEPANLSVLSNHPSNNPKNVKSRETILKEMALKAARDFNPDMKWAANHKLYIHYSSQQNAVVCPYLGLNSQSMSIHDRIALHRSHSPFSNTNLSIQADINTGGNIQYSPTANTTIQDSEGPKRDAQTDHASEK